MHVLGPSIQRGAAGQPAAAAPALPTAVGERLIRREAMVGNRSAFIDAHTPGSHLKDNFAIIGRGVSENSEQFINMREPHGFNIGAAVRLLAARPAPGRPRGRCPCCCRQQTPDNSGCVRQGQPPKITNSLHSHFTAEVFIVHEGSWLQYCGLGREGQVTLQPGDVISIPTHVRAEAPFSAFSRA